MTLPLRKKGRDITLTLSKELYPLQTIEKALAEFSIRRNSTKPCKSSSIKITFKKSDLSTVLEFSNYLLFINR